VLVAHHPDGTLYAAGGASVMLLFVGIHNAWDIAVWMSLRKRDEAGARESKPEGAAGGPRAAG
jgi:hypothetical protein